MPENAKFYKSIRNLSFSRERYNEYLTYAEDKIIPDRINSANAKYRFLKIAKLFTSINRQLWLITNIVPPDISDEHGDPLIPLELPLKYRVVAEDEVKSVLDELWGNPIGGGWSRKSLFEKISREFIGISRSMVDTFFKNTELHQINKNTSKGVVIPIIKETPMDMWGMDLIDVSRLHSKLNSNITFIMNIVDYHSKYAWSVPLKNKSLSIIAYELQTLFLSEGAPKSIMTDNEFNKQEIKLLCERFNVKYKHTAPYTPEQNGLVERFNKTIKTNIHNYLAENNKKRYIDALPLLVHQYNTTKHSTTGFTPFELHRHLWRNSPAIHLVATKNIKKQADKMVRQSLRNMNRENSPLEIGDLVRVDLDVFVAHRKMGAFEKRAKKISKWSKEVYTVVEIDTKEDGKRMYRIADEDGGEPVEGRYFYHRRQLQLVKGDSLKEIGDSKNTEDLFFGRYDPERHISTLSRRLQAESLIDQRDLEIRYIEDDMKNLDDPRFAPLPPLPDEEEQKDSSSDGDETEAPNKRPARNRKKVQKLNL